MHIPNQTHWGGCVNDARAWAAAMRDLGFDARTLLDEHATRQEILNAMERLINDSRPGNVGVIQYSGHGIQVKDLDGDEADGQDEAIVPIDFESGRFIIDDDLRGLLQVTPEGVSLTCFMECCHSGTKTRLFVPNPVTERGASKPRFMRITAELNERHISFRARPSACEAGERRNAGSELCPCLSEQVAYETEGSGDITRRALPILRAGTSA